MDSQRRNSNWGLNGPLYSPHWSCDITTALMAQVLAALFFWMTGIATQTKPWHQRCYTRSRNQDKEISFPRKVSPIATSTSVWSVLLLLNMIKLTAKTNTLLNTPVFTTRSMRRRVQNVKVARMAKMAVTRMTKVSITGSQRHCHDLSFIPGYVLWVSV